MSKQNRWRRKISDFSHIRTGSKVKVQMGAGTANGIMTQRCKDHIMVQLSSTKKMIAVWDARNVE
jgi:sRNA-binding protein